MNTCWTVTKILGGCIAVGCLVAIIAGGCGGSLPVTREQAAQASIDGMRATCLLYQQPISGIPRAPELDAICPVLLSQPVVTVPAVPVPVDAGGEGGERG